MKPAFKTLNFLKMSFLVGFPILFLKKKVLEIPAMMMQILVLFSDAQENVFFRRCFGDIEYRRRNIDLFHKSKLK